MEKSLVHLSLDGVMENQEKEKEKIKFYICFWAKSFYMYECSKEFAQGFLDYSALMGKPFTGYGKGHDNANSYFLDSIYVSPDWTQLKGYRPKIWTRKDSNNSIFNDYIALMEATLEYREIKD